MSKRGRRKNSNRRKSSSSSKQSISPYIFQKQNKSNSVSYKDDLVEKGESDSYRKEHVLSGSEDEERFSNSSPPKEKRFKQDYYMNSFPNQKSIYTKTTEDKENGVKIITSVSISDMEDSFPKILFQQSHEPLSENLPHSSTPVTNIMKINCTSSNVKLEIQEILQVNASSIKTTLVFMNEKGDSAETFLKSKCEKTWTPNNDQPAHKVSTPHSDYRFTFGEQTDTHSPTKRWDSPNYCHCCCDHKQQIPIDFIFASHPSSPPILLNIESQAKKKHLHKSFSSDQCWDIPPPQEFADIKCTSLEDLTFDLASCRIGTCSLADEQQGECHLTPEITWKHEPIDVVEAEEMADPPPFDQFSEWDHYEPMFMRASLSTNRSSFIKDFINCQKRKSWIRNNSIATVEHRACPLPKKRRQTFPCMSEALGLMPEDLVMPCCESFSSLIMCSLHLQTERPQRTHRDTERFSASGQGNDESSQTQGSSKQESAISSSIDEKQPLLSPFYTTSSEDNTDDVFAVNQQTSLTFHHKDIRQQAVFKEMESVDTDDCEYKVDQYEVADSGFDQEIGDIDSQSPEPLAEELCKRALAIQVIPASCSGSEEQILQSHPVILFQSNDVGNTTKEVSFSASPEHRRSSVRTITVGALEQRFMQTDSLEKPTTAMEDHYMSTLQDIHVRSLNANENIYMNNEALGEKTRNITPSSPVMVEKRMVNKQIPIRFSSEAKEHLKPVLHKDSDNSCSDHWAKRRKLFRETKQWSSAGGSSVTSDITEESVSEETRSLDMTVQDNENRGFYTETFHSSAWIYQGDDVSSGAIAHCLNTKTRVVSIRERTVKISKGTGEYPWGFRIQFSKPIVVTEVDTNGAAEEAGLMVGDYVLAVNGTDVTSIPHSEAATLARQGPDVLILTIGSDIARCPNTPRPACRGYLHKRTKSGLIKGWRKRWFVLTHDCCLHYYRHKRDEGKRRPLCTVKLEGAEVGQDTSLGKPFVFMCRPQSANRVYFFCATSNQEMKRWLEAMEKAIHPITQNHVWVDVTRYNSILPPLAVKSPECLGLLHKIDKNKDTWLQHYCILKDGCLYLYSGIRATHAHGGIYLQGYIVREQPYGSKKSTIELKPPSDEFKTFYLCAENPNENKRWIVAIKASIKKWLPLHQALQDYINQPPEETRM